MAKIKKKSLDKTSFSYENYCKGDPFFDFLRCYYKNQNILDGDRWKSIVNNDKLHMEKIKKKKINDRRNYGND